MDCFFLTPHSSDGPIRFCDPDTPPLSKKKLATSLWLEGQRPRTPYRRRGIVWTTHNNATRSTYRSACGTLNTFSCFRDFGLLPPPSVEAITIFFLSRFFFWLPPKTYKSRNAFPKKKIWVKLGIDYELFRTRLFENLLNVSAMPPRKRTSRTRTVASAPMRNTSELIKTP